MSEAPLPLTPSDCDLTDFGFMPLDVRRLRDSDLAALESPEACWAAVLLWCASWHQVPAASLPDDDRVLSNLAGYGRVVKEWQRVRDGALRGWVKCSDGRLYHPVVAEKANESWKTKVKYAYDKLADRTRKANGKREKEGLPALAIPTIEQWISAGRPEQFQEPTLHVPPETRSSSSGKKDNSAGIPPENALKGEGEEQGYIKDKNTHPQTPSPESLDTGDPGHTDACDDSPPYGDPKPAGLLAKTLRSLGVSVASGNPDFCRWVESGLSESEAVEAVEIARKTKPAPETIPWAYLAKVLASQRNAAVTGVPDKQGSASTAKAGATRDTWWTSNAGIDRKGREMGMFARPTEDYASFKDRIFEAIRARDAQGVTG